MIELERGVVMTFASPTRDRGGTHLRFYLTQTEVTNSTTAFRQKLALTDYYGGQSPRRRIDYQATAARIAGAIQVRRLFAYVNTLIYSHQPQTP